MRKTIPFLICSVFFSCSADVENKISESNVDSTTHTSDNITGENATPEILWDIKLYSTNSQSDELTNARVNLVVKRGNKYDTLPVGKFQSPLEIADKTLPVWQTAPKNTVDVLSGWWAGAGDNIYLTSDKPGNYIITWQPISEEGDLPAEKLKQINVPSSLNEKCTIDDIKK